MAVSPSQTGIIPKYWPSARYFTEAIQCPSICFAHPLLRNTLPAVDRLGMPLVTSGQFAYVYKLNSLNGNGEFAVRCFRGYLGDRDQRYRAIQEHLRFSPVPYLSEFSYAPEGILVGGDRFPILFMKWIEGPTLDLYVSEMLDRRDVLLHLSEEWLRLLSGLHASGMAHGDLQHGNIIVEHGQLRLVDHDGIFVPQMSGWTASEVGHQHYQHPQRDARHFDAELDNFSSLVIYLSLLSLAERPDLWAEHYDENLIFTKKDFADPATSSLFRKVKELGSEHNRLADVLAEAATRDPAAVPCLLELVKRNSTLPSWMTAPVDLDGTIKTREVVPAQPALEREPIRWMPRHDKSTGASVPSTPVSASVLSLFSAPTIPTAPNAANLLQTTTFFTRELMKRYFLWWYWAAYILLDFLGFDFLLSLVAALTIVSAAGLVFGLIRALDEGRKAQASKLSSGLQQISLAAAPLPQPPPLPQPASWTPGVSPPPTPIGVSDPFVGNVVLGIFHLENCVWVEHISAKNQVTFSSVAEAQSHGFKPCRICAPAT